MRLKAELHGLLGGVAKKICRALEPIGMDRISSTPISSNDVMTSPLGLGMGSNPFQKSARYSHHPMEIGTLPLSMILTLYLLEDAHLPNGIDPWDPLADKDFNLPQIQDNFFGRVTFRGHFDPPFF